MLGLLCEEAVRAGELLGDVRAVDSLAGRALHPLSSYTQGSAGVAVLAVVVTLACQAEKG